MALIIRKLKHKEDYSSVTLDEADRRRISDVEVVEENGSKYRVASYDVYSRPVDSHRLTYVEKYNGGIEESPVTVFTNRGGQLVVNKNKLAVDLQRKWGDGQYSVFKFGGNPPKESYFENRFIEKIDEEQSEEKV